MKNNFLKELELNKGKIVRLTYTLSFRPNDIINVITLIKKIDYKLEYVFCGHPYDIDKQYTTSGEMGLQYNIDKAHIEAASSEDIKLWLTEYIKFHKSVMKEKGYDSCEEDIFAVAEANGLTIVFK